MFTLRIKDTPKLSLAEHDAEDSVANDYRPENYEQKKCTYVVSSVILCEIPRSTEEYVTTNSNLYLLTVGDDLFL